MVCQTSYHRVGRVGCRLTPLPVASSLQNGRPTEICRCIQSTLGNYTSTSYCGSRSGCLHLFFVEWSQSVGLAGQ
jgi:hypothetical protein